MIQKSVLPYVWMLLGSLTFATMAALARALTTRCDWQLIAILRAFLAFTFAVILTVAAGAQLVVFRPRILWTRSIAGSLAMLCSFFAFKHLPVSEVLTLSNMFPIWVALLSWPLLKERPSLSVWLSVVSGVAGVALIQQPRLAEGNFAALVALSGSVATAVAMLGLHRLAYLDTRAVVAHFSGVATLFCAAAFFLFDTDPSLHNNLDGWTMLMLLGVGVTATVGQLFLTKAFTEGPPAKVSVVGLTQVVFAMGYDVLCWQRTFDLATLVGIVLVLAPTAWLLLQPTKH